MIRIHLIYTYSREITSIFEEGSGIVKYILHKEQIVVETAILFSCAAHNGTMDKQKIMPVLTGFATGVCNGIFGAGGGMVAVAALKKFCKMDTKCAHATAISVMLPLTFVSGLVYALNNAVEWEVLLYVAPPLFVGGILGAKLTGRLKSVWLNRIFGALMIAAGVWMTL